MIPKIIDIPVFSNMTGDLSFAQNNDQFPFRIKRIFWNDNFKELNKEIGGHEYFNQKEVIISMIGNFEVVTINSDNEKTKFYLDSPNKGLFIPPNYWRYMCKFSENFLALHVVDTSYSKSDYIKDFSHFTAKDK